MREPLAIVQVGACCPVGLDVVETATSLRAGVSRKIETGFIDRELEPIVVGHVEEPDLPELAAPLRAQAGNSLQRRLLRLATGPLREVLQGFVGQSPPLYLAVPQAGPGQAELVNGQLLGQLAMQAELGLELGASRMFTTGRAGLFAAVAAAADELLAERCPFVLVGGVDSYLDGLRLATLEAEQRLRTTGPQDAFTPGEAAAFVLLASRVSCRQLGLQPLAWLMSVGLGHEPGHRYSDQPFLGEGLAAAVQEAFAQARPPLEPIRLLLTGLNGERMLAKEGGVALLRNRGRFAAELQVEHAAESIGDAGAALAPLMMAATAHRMRLGKAAGPALLWGSSDQGQRGALIMRAAP